MMMHVLALLTAASASQVEVRVRFVASLTTLRSIVNAVGGERVQGISLCAGNQDPHFLDPKPTFLVKLRDADLFVLNGLDLEVGWAPPLLEGARNPRILRGRPGYLDASAGIPVVELPPLGTTRAEGDVHPYGNPHYLLDPLNGILVAKRVRDKLEELDPEGGPTYERGFQEFRSGLVRALFGKELVEAVGEEKLERLARGKELDSFLEANRLDGNPLTASLGGWLERARPLRGTRVITYHRDLSYLADRFDLQVVDFVEPKPGIPPTTAHRLELVEKIRREGVRFILTHSYYDDRAPAFLSEKTGIRVLTIPAAVGSVPEARDYIALFDVILDRLLEHKS